MSESGHDIHAHFREHSEALHKLKMNNPHYRELSDRYHGLAQRIARGEHGLDPVSDDLLEELKKQRLDILDQIAAMIAQETFA